MSNIEPPAIARPTIRTVVVPSAIQAAASRANLSLMDLLVFGKLRQVASLEDIAVFACLNDWLAVGGCRVATGTLREAMSLGDGSAAEFSAVFDRMVTSDAMKKLAQEAVADYADPFAQLLSLKQNKAVAETVPNAHQATLSRSARDLKGDLPYQLKTSGSNVFVAVGPGFHKYVGVSQVKEESASFVRSFLELCTDLFSSSEVARHPLFKSFLHSLADQPA